MPEPIDYVGVDIAAEHLDYCVNEQEEGRVANDGTGRSKLIERLLKMPHPRVICEASGGYEKPFVAELLAMNVEVCVVQPGRVRAFAYAEGLLAKNDKIDARLLRRFGQKVEVRLAEPVSLATSVLRELLDHRRQLVTQKAEVESRLRVAGKTMSKLLERQLRFLTDQIDVVDKMIKEHIDSDPDLKDKLERLQQVKGVGPILASTLLAYVPELGRVDGAQLSSLVGVAPYDKDSGKTKGLRHIRAGRGPVRHVLYMAAVCASKYNPILSAFYHRLKANGKPAKVCIVAVMRKLLCLLNRLIQYPNFILAS